MSLNELLIIRDFEVTSKATSKSFCSKLQNLSLNAGFTTGGTQFTGFGSRQKGEGEGLFPGDFFPLQAEELQLRNSESFAIPPLLRGKEAKKAPFAG